MGTRIIVYETHPIFAMSDMLQATQRHKTTANILDVNVNPNSLQVLIDYAECREANQYGDTDAGEIIQELLAKIFSDGALRWAVRALRAGGGGPKNQRKRGH